MKIKISWLWIFFLPFVVVTHFYKVFFFLFILMSIHESFHILCAHYFGYHIERVCVYPFGLSAQIKNFEYHQSIQEIIIILSGLSVHLIAAFFIPFLCEILAVSENFSLYLERCNFAILFFNLLPIYPLDGGRLLRNCFEFFLPFKSAKALSLLITILLIPVIFFVFPFTRIQFYFFSLFFSIQVFTYIYQFKEDVESFYLYRFLNFKKRRVKIHQKRDLYKNRENYIVQQGMMMNEYEFLRKYIE